MPDGITEVRPAIGVRDRDLAEALKRPVHIGRAVAEQHALAMVGVRAYAHVGRDAQLGHRLLHRVDRAGDDVIALARDERAAVLAVGRPEQQEAGEAGGRRRAGVADEFGER